MKIRRHILAIFILIGFAATAYAEVERTYDMIGVINTLELHKGNITINGEQYSLNSSTRIHGLKKGQIADMFNLGIEMPIGFNFDKATNDIKEIWILGTHPGDIR